MLLALWLGLLLAGASAHARPPRTRILTATIQAVAGEQHELLVRIEEPNREGQVVRLRWSRTLAVFNANGELPPAQLKPGDRIVLRPSTTLVRLARGNDDSPRRAD